MLGESPGIKLFRVAGIQVYLNWTWFLVAAWQIERAKSDYSQPVYAVIEYLALFGIVLIHEFGHALACRQTGGQADRILLWPFGGVAFVSPPPRPGAHLWSIAAGPLVNVVLLPVLAVLVHFAMHGPWDFTRDQLVCLRNIQLINAALLIFNMLPVYPLDGGQILQSLLWFKFGRSMSLLIAVWVGFVGCGLLALYALSRSSMWMGIMVFYAGSQCWRGFQAARQMRAWEKANGLKL